jgi:hypothetical protein
MKGQKTIYFSHAWGGVSDEILAQLVRRLEEEKIAFILDKRDLGYRQSIHDFMVKLGKADMVIIILSNKYLKSEYCMFELIQIYHNENLTDRIFPIVLDEVKISSSVDRLEFVKFWENQLAELQNKVKELNSLSFIEGITDDLNLYSEIRNNIARLTGILRDINTLNITLHQESDYHDLIEAIRKRINEEPAVLPADTVIENKAEPTSDDHPKTESTPANRPTGIPVKIRNLVIVALALFGLFMLWGILSKSNSLANNNDVEADHAITSDTPLTKPPLANINLVPKDTVKKETPTITEQADQQKPVSSIKKSKPVQEPVKENKPKITSTLPATHIESQKESSTSAFNPPQNAKNETPKEPVIKADLNRSMMIPKGTLITARNNVAFSSDDPDPLPRRVTFVLDKTIYDGPSAVVPSGSLIIGTVVKVRKSEHKRSGNMDLNFEYILAPGGQKIPLQSNEMHLEAKGSVPYEIQINTKLQIKTSSTVTIKY